MKFRKVQLVKLHCICRSIFCMGDVFVFALYVCVCVCVTLCILHLGIK